LGSVAGLLTQLVHACSLSQAIGKKRLEKVHRDEQERLRKEAGAPAFFFREKSVLRSII
jgi:hypothetical protein